ncbi:MAG: hypothetical protein NTZ60_00795 [Campylobacterales bacterium]|nr:hypothetical protein [Campylobacterales bacterium]
MINHKGYDYFGVYVIFICLAILVVFEAYGHLLVTILLSGFYTIVVQSKKYPRLWKLFDDAF